MQIRRIIALGGTTLALVLAPLLSTTALAAGTAVTVRVEGKSHTLLPTTRVQVHGGSITKGGAPAGRCPASRAAGALDTATHHHWNGKYSSGSGLGIEITQILGETHIYSTKGYYWGIWVDNRFASAGICDLNLRRGEQLLFAPSPGTGTAYPLAIEAPSHATAGHPFKVKVVDYPKSAAKPVSGVRVAGAGAVTNAQGIVAITPKRAGKLTLRAHRSGHIRSGVTTVIVSG